MRVKKTNISCTLSFIQIVPGTILCPGDRKMASVFQEFTIWWVILRSIQTVAMQCESSRIKLNIKKNEYF